MLSENERRSLARIERQIRARDPRLARQLEDAESTLATRAGAAGRSQGGLRRCLARLDRRALVAVCALLLLLMVAAAGAPLVLLVLIVLFLPFGTLALVRMWPRR